MFKENLLSIRKREQVILFIALVFVFNSFFLTNCQASESLSYSGRLVQTNGAPVAGTVDLKVELAYSNATATILCSQNFTGVVLSNGVFHLKLDLACGGYGTLAEVLASVPTNESAAIRVTDVTHSKAYSFQALHSMPFASVSGTAKQLLRMGATNGQALVWNGSQWAPSTVGTGNGTVTSIVTGTGLTGGPITTTGTISIANGGVGTTEIAASAVTDAKIAAVAASKVTGTLTGAQIGSGVITNAHVSATAAIDYSKLNVGVGEIPQDRISGLSTSMSALIEDVIADAVTGKAPSQNAVHDALVLKLDLAGGTMLGALGVLALPVGDYEAVPKKYVDDKETALNTSIGAKVSKTGDTMTGDLQINTKIKLQDSGSNTISIQAPTTVTSSYVLKLPPAVGTANQVLTTDASGVLSWTTPASSAAPSGAAGGDLGGTYPNPTVPGLATKISTTLANGNILVGSAGGVATAVAVSGDATLANTGAVTLKDTGTVGTYTSVTTDAQGRVVSGSNPTVVTGVSITAPITNTGTAAVPVIGMPAAATAMDGYLTSTDWNTFNNKQTAITAASTINLRESRFNELGVNGVNYVGLKSPDSLAADVIYTLPATDGSIGQILKTNGAGVLGWVTDNAGAGAFSGTAIRAVVTDAGGALTTSATTAVELGYVNGVTSAIQTQLNAKQASGNYVTALTGDVTAMGPGSVAATVASVGGVAAANVATGANLANAATNLNTANTIVKRDASGNFAAGTITATLNGTATNVSGTVAVANGGTGNTTLGLNQLLFGNGTSAIGGLATTATPSVLLSTVTTGAPAWTTSTTGNVLKGSVTGVAFGPLAASDLPTGTLSGSGTTNYVPYYSAATTLANSPMAVSGSNVGIGTNAPGAKLEVAGQIKITGGTPGANKVLTSDAAGLASWVTPAAAPVTSVNTLTGAVVLTTTNVAEGTNLYHTDARTVAAPLTGYVVGANSVLAATDTILGAFGKVQGQLNSKQSATLSNGNILVGSVGNIATAVALSGDATIINTGAITLKNTGTAGTYTSVTTDAQGRVTAGTNPVVVTSLTVTAPVTNTGTATVPLIGMPAATTSVNGYLTSTDWNTFNNKQASITSASALNTGSVTTNLQGGVVVNPYGVAAGNTGEIRLMELAANGANYVALKSPDALAANISFTLPTTVGTNGQVLTSNGANPATLSWSTPLAGTVTSVTSANTDIAVATTTTTPVLTLNSGTGANQIVKLNGTSQLPAVDGSLLTSLNPANLSAVVPVTKGGTGLAGGTSGGIPYYNSATTMASSALLGLNGVVLGGGAGAAPTSTAAGIADQVLRIPGAGGAPAFGAIDLTKAAAVTGALPLANGGTGATTAAAARTNLGLGTAATQNTGSLINNIPMFGANATVGSMCTYDLTLGFICNTAIPTGNASTTNPLSQFAATTSAQLAGVLSDETGTGLAVFGTSPTIANPVIANISPAANFTLTQNAVVPFTSESVGAVVNTLYLKTGNVGIGTTAPGAKLNVQNTNPVNPSGLLVDNSMADGSDANYAAEFRVGGTNIMSIRNSGKIGVGTITPAAMFDVSPTIIGNSDIKMVRSGMLYNAGLTMANYYGVYVAAPTGSGVITNKYALVTEAGAGNVGIGTTTPAYGLDVINGFFHSGYNAQTIPASSNGLIVGWNRSSGQGEVNLYNGYDLQGTGNKSFQFSQKTAAGTYADLMTMMGNGNVGIGNTSPGALLDIGLAGTTRGTMRLEGNTSGYVQIQPSAAAGSWTMTLPGGAGANGQVLTTNGSGVLSWASAGGSGDALVANPLSQFAATTSAQLAGVLSDEIGSGVAVFGTSPTFSGVPLAPTAAANTSTDQIATTAFVMGQVGANITSTGTIASGTWNGSVVGMTYGGTGANITPVNGGIIYSNATTMAATAAGTSGQYLKSAGAAAPAWSSILLGDLISSVAGNLFPATGCGVSENLIYVLATDSFSCAIALAGTAATPGYAFSGDANTGMFGAAADQIGFATAGSERVRIDASGNVGIGTTAPGTALDIQGQIRSRTKDNTSLTTIDWNNGNMQYTTDSCQSYMFNNIVDGASYTWTVKGATSSTCTFTAAGLTFRFYPTNAATTANTHTVYTFFRQGADVYVSWITGL